MLTSPVAGATALTWAHAVATDLPKALRLAFPPSGPGATAPESEQPALRGTGAATALRFPASGRWHHAQANGSNVHWIWGSAADVLLHGDLATRLTLGNPLIALRFEDAADASADKGEKKGVALGDPVELAGTPVSTADLLVVARVPGAPGLDTLSVLRYAADSLGTITAGTPTWQDFVASMSALTSPLRVLDPGGSPAVGRTIAIVGGAGPVTLTSAHRGDALRALGITRAALGAGPVLDVLAGAPGVATSGGEPHADGRVPLTTDSHLVTAANLEDWFGEQGATSLERFTRGNHVTPFSDGLATYADLFDEANRAADPASGAAGAFYVTGYSLHHDATLAPSGMALRTVESLAEHIAANGGDARFLALQMIQLNPGFVATTETVLAVSSIILAAAGTITAGVGFGNDGGDAFSFFSHASAIAVMLAVAAGDLESMLDSFDLNRGAIEGLDGLAGVEAHLDPVDADVDDNPLAFTTGDLAAAALTAQRRFNVFHQKIQVVRNDRGVHAYCGGIDLNTNRLQSPAHTDRSPFHDVHARVNGRAAGELATTFIERWDRASSTPLALAAAGALDGLPTDGEDVVQVARTYYGPEPGSGRGLTFAPTGERTILDTLVSAISRARRYIYIEDQYLTPPQEYRDALVAAARHVSGPLIIVVPSDPDQPFGLPRRQAFIAELAADDAWGDRLRVGVLRKRFSHTGTNRDTAKGRLWLDVDVSETEDLVKLAPKERVPDTPFWITVGSEAMRVHQKVAGITDPDAVMVRVERGTASRLFTGDKGTKTKAHTAKAAVLGGMFPDIYVHAKMMLVDDAFASIGSANANRRGFYSDGECNIFAMRERVADGDNWIRDLRIALWAEHLGLTPEFADVALRDPGAALPLFDRSFVAGCRFTPFAAQPYATMGALATEFNDRTTTLPGIAVILTFWAALGELFAGAEADHLFDTFIDPSSTTAPP